MKQSPFYKLSHLHEEIVTEILKDRFLQKLIEELKVLFNTREELFRCENDPVFNTSFIFEIKQGVISNITMQEKGQTYSQNKMWKTLIQKIRLKIPCLTKNQILNLVFWINGYSAKDIASLRNHRVKEGTVRSHTMKACENLNCHSRGDLIALLREKKLLLYFRTLLDLYFFGREFEV